MMTKRKARKILKSFLKDMERPSIFDDKYFQYHQVRIEAVKWLLAYYEGRTAATPEELLHSFLEDTRSATASVDLKLHRLTWIDVLYHWIKNKEIVGF